MNMCFSRSLSFCALFLSFMITVGCSSDHPHSKRKLKTSDGVSTIEQIGFKNLLAQAEDYDPESFDLAGSDMIIFAATDFDLCSVTLESEFDFRCRCDQNYFDIESIQNIYGFIPSTERYFRMFPEGMGALNLSGKRARMKRGLIDSSLVAMFGRQTCNPILDDILDNFFNPPITGIINTDPVAPASTASDCQVSSEDALSCVLPNNNTIEVIVSDGDGVCPEHSSLLTYDEADQIGTNIGGIAPTWGIMRLANNGSMVGSGYGYKIRSTDTRSMGDSLCRVTRKNSDSSHLFLTRKPNDSFEGLRLTDNDDLNYKHDFEIPEQEISFVDDNNQTQTGSVHVRSVIGFGGMSKPKAFRSETHYYLWYNNGKYSTEKDMHHNAVLDYTFDSELQEIGVQPSKVTTHDIVTMASYNNNEKSDGERVLTFFEIDAAAGKYYLTIGSANNLTKHSNEWGIRVTVPEGSTIVGASAFYAPQRRQSHPNRAILKVWLSNYQVFQINSNFGFESRFVPSINLRDLDDNSGWNDGDITMSTYTLPDGYSHSDILGFATVDGNHEYKIYYSETADPENQGIKVGDLNLAIFDDENKPQDMKNALDPSQTLDELDSYFQSVSFSTPVNNLPDTDNPLTFLWDGVGSAPSPEMKCINAGIDAGINAGDLLLDIVGSIPVAKQAYVSAFEKELKVTIADFESLGEAEKVEKAKEAFWNKFFAPIELIKAGHATNDTYKFFKGLTAFFRHTLGYLQQGIRHFFVAGNWKDSLGSWLKFGVTLAVTVFDAVATDGLSLYAKLAVLSWDVEQFIESVVAAHSECAQLREEDGV